MKQKIIFFGSGLFVIPVVERLLDHGLDLVITNDKNPNSGLLNFCKEKNVKAVVASTASELVNNKSSIVNHDVAVLASYGAFIPNEVINLFENGIINIHPSLLPLWKGPSPVQFSLLSGATQIGVTLIKLDNEIDHGPILAQKPYNLTGNETSEDLLSILFEIGAEMVEELVVKLENGETPTETPQDHSKETWSYKVEKKDGMINLSSIPDKEKLKNMIKAYFPWPGVWFKYEPNVIASKTKQSPKLSGKIIKLLPENRVQVEGKNAMNYKDFVNGFGDEGREILEKLNLI